MSKTRPGRKFFKQSPLTDLEWKQFFEEGYCIVRNIFYKEEMNRIHMVFNEVLDSVRTLAHKMGASFNGSFTYKEAQFVIENDVNGDLERVHRICGCGSLDETILEATRSPSLLHAFSDLLMAEAFEQLICQFHPKMSGDGVDYHVHRDIEHRMNIDPSWQDTNGWGSYVVAFIALESADASNGGLVIVPESHLDINLDSLQPAADDDFLEWESLSICPKLNVGDVLFMHPYLVHWSNANNGESTRFSLLSGMSSIGANSTNYPGSCTNAILNVNSMKKSH